MKEKKKIAALLGLVIVAALVWYVEMRRPSVTSHESAADFRKYDPLPIENPAIQWDKIDRARKTEYRSNGRDLFSEIAPPPPQTVADRKKAAAAAAVAANPGPPPPPPPPSLPPNLKFFGYGTIPNGTARRAFLTDGEDIYILGEGDTLLGKYRVVRIGNANLDFEEITTGRRGSTVLDEQAAPPA